ncbi:MAG: hypothetical protein JW863_18990 [Chitinispirillaceae bacterium]|nr:hypothetical protein [Chitinispirillaceae bacterium]
MKKFLGWTLAGLVVGLGMVGCDLLGPVESTSPTITLDAIGSIDAGTFKNIEGKVTAGEDITQIKYQITTATGGSVSTITVEGPSSASSDKIEFKGNDVIKISVSSSAAEGDYILKITATAGVTSSAEFDFSVSGGSTGTPVTEVTINAGANQNNDYGSSIDIDAGKAMIKSEAASNVSDIDLCYAYSGVNSVEKLGTAAWAVASDYTFADGWANAPDIKFYKVSMTADEFAAVDTKEEIDDLWDASKATANSYNAAEGDVFMVETTEGTLAILRITSQIDGAAGSITMKVAK